MSCSPCFWWNPSARPVTMRKLTPSGWSCSPFFRGTLLQARRIQRSTTTISNWGCSPCFSWNPSARDAQCSYSWQNTKVTVLVFRGILLQAISGTTLRYSLSRCSPCFRGTLLQVEDAIIVTIGRRSLQSLFFAEPFCKS